MKKNTPVKKNVQTVYLPDVVDIDTLAYASDDELVRRVSHLNNDREKAGRFGYSQLPWEVEICYVQRELKIRQDRKVAHDEYLVKFPENRLEGSYLN